MRVHSAQYFQDIAFSFEHQELWAALNFVLILFLKVFFVKNFVVEYIYSEQQKTHLADSETYVFCVYLRSHLSKKKVI